ncbi:MAG TPA: choice-of-anchor V domain-containing protein [Gemmatimonadaceae bacterium]
MTAAPEPQSKGPASAAAGAGRFMWRKRIRDIALLGLSLGASVSVAQLHGNGVVGVAQAREAPAFAYRDGPPPGFSGGFKEDTCVACHFDYALNVNPGRLTLSAPERYTPGETYTLTVTLTRPRMKVGGFQLTARFEEDGAQAGTLTVVPGDEKRIKVSPDRGVQYAYHQRPGTQLVSRDTARWTLRWTAPARGGTVVFNVAGNAANEDDTQFGDYIYATSARAVASGRSR